MSRPAGGPMHATDHEEPDGAEHLRALLDGLDAVVFEGDAAGRLTFVSAGVRTVFGDDPADWLGPPERLAERVEPEDRDRVLAAIAHAAGGTSPFDLEIRARSADAMRLRLHVVGRPTRDERGRPTGFRGLLLDVTARGIAAGVEDAEGRYRALVEQLPAIVYVEAWGPQAEGPGPLLYVSSQLERVLGYHPEEWIHDPGAWGRALHPEDRDRVRRLSADATRAGGPLRMQYRIRAKDGRVVWVQDDAVIVTDEEGAPRYWQGVILDITEGKEAELDLEREREISRRLREVDEMKNTFLQAVSHDLRTPLAAILGLAATLGRPDLGLPIEDVRDLAARIEQNARRLDRMVADLLDLDRLGSGVFEPELRQTDLGALVRRIASETPAVGARTLEVRTEEVVLPLDPPEVERIVENLLANAGRHTPEGTHVWVRVLAVAGGGELRVEDDGPGVPERERAAIFEPFRRGAETADRGTGVGIGLALVARLAELHGGRAWVIERGGGGASFRVFFPDDGPQAPEGPADPPARGTPAEDR